jgi:hypothetical protein
MLHFSHKTDPDILIIWPERHRIDTTTSTSLDLLLRMLPSAVSHSHRVHPLLVGPSSTTKSSPKIAKHGWGRESADAAPQTSILVHPRKQPLLEMAPSSSPNAQTSSYQGARGVGLPLFMQRESILRRVPPVGLVALARRPAKKKPTVRLVPLHIHHTPNLP